MATYKYNLSYLDENNNMIPSNKDGKNIFNSSIEMLDNATTNFDSYGDLINFLKVINAIPQTVNELHITYNKKDDNGNIVQESVNYGDILFFKNDKKKLCYDYVLSMFQYYKEHPDDLLKLCSLYVNKYSLTDEQKEEPDYKHKYKHFINMLNRVKILVQYANLKKNYYFETCHYTITLDFEKDIKNFMIKEFFRPKTKSGLKVNYSNIRDFVIKSNIVLNGESIIKNDTTKKETIITKKQKELEIEEIYDKEEFDTIEDYQRDSKKLLENYKPNYEAYQDGNDWIAPSTKKELMESFDGYAKKYSLKPGDGDL